MLDDLNRMQHEFHQTTWTIIWQVSNNDQDDVKQNQPTSLIKSKTE